MLRAQIYRLRRLIKKSLPEGEDEKQYMSINFSNGYYSLDIGEKVIIDIYEFERLAALGDDNIIGDANAAAEYYENALNLLIEDRIKNKLITHSNDKNYDIKIKSSSIVP